MVWQKSMDFVAQIYQLTRAFPDHEKYGLTSQIRRASISIPSNIAEGAGRNSKKEFAQFLYISLGSLAEVETQLLIAEKLEYCSNAELNLESLDDIRRLLLGLIRNVKKSWSLVTRHFVTRHFVTRHSSLVPSHP